MNILQANNVELVANAVRTATLTPANGVDIRQYDGPAQIILMASAATAGTSPTLNIKLQHSDVVNDGFEDVPGAAFNQVTDAADLTQMIPVQASALKRYVRCLCTHGGTNTPTFGYGVVMVAFRHNGRNSTQVA